MSTVFNIRRITFSLSQILFGNVIFFFKGLNMKVFLMPNLYSYNTINTYKANLFSGTLDYVKEEIKKNTQELQPCAIRI